MNFPRQQEEIMTDTAYDRARVNEATDLFREAVEFRYECADSSDSQEQVIGDKILEQNTSVAGYLTALRGELNLRDKLSEGSKNPQKRLKIAEAGVRIEGLMDKIYRYVIEVTDLKMEFKALRVPEYLKEYRKIYDEAVELRESCFKSNNPVYRTLFEEIAEAITDVNGTLEKLEQAETGSEEIPEYFEKLDIFARRIESIKRKIESNTKLSLIAA